MAQRNPDAEVTHVERRQRFSGSVPELYESHLVPLIFEPYAADLKQRLASLDASKILEVAAGTGVVTRALATLGREGMSITPRI